MTGGVWRRARHRWCALIVASAVLGGSSALTWQAVAQPATLGDVQSVSAESQASAGAAELGERVEVVAERTERETVFANPDGVTFTLEKSVTPVRVHDGNGGWAAPDATMVKRADGSVGPKAAAVKVVFSPGGDGADLVRIAEGAQSVSLGWPGNLPAPRLEGERAIYENVLPDVNLIMTATVEGFRQVLEVETPEAAANPALKSIEFALKADNLAVQAGAGGGVEALDGNGQVVFHSPAAQMWNSAGDATAATAVPAASTEPTQGPSAQRCPLPRRTRNQLPCRQARWKKVIRWRAPARVTSQLSWPSRSGPVR